MRKARIKEFLRQRVRLRLYSRLAICYTVILALVAFAFAVLASRYYENLQATRKLKDGMYTLNAISSYYELKHTSFPDLILPLFQSGNGYKALESLMRDSTDGIYDDPARKQEIIEAFGNVAERDGDIEEILLYSNRSHTLYVYSGKYNTLETAGPGYPFYDVVAKPSMGRTATGTRKLLTLDSQNKRDIGYGIGSTIRSSTDSESLGQFLVLFNAKKIESIFRDYSGNYGRFLIIKLNGDIVFDSENSYVGGKYPYVQELISQNNTATIDGTPCYVQTVKGQKADFLGVNIVPKRLLDDPYVPALVYGAFTVMVLSCALLYVASGKLISRRVKEIESAMKRVGLNDLAYRLPVHYPIDEFSEMALRFNEMCGKLQKSIDREYAAEIKKRSAELGLLQAGINPHFLYNTLEVIRVKAVDNQDGDVAQMILDLANLYREIVRSRTFIPIRNEINICGMYMNLFSLRYDTCLNYEADIEPRVMKFGISKNLLQPIIENYFVHGIRKGDHFNYFSISGFLKDGDIYFIFEDNGRGISGERLEKLTADIGQVKPDADTGYGLLNIQKRIRLIYGEPYGLRLESKENIRTRVTLRLKAMTCGELEQSLKSLSKREG